MYHQISRNKRNSIIVITGFLLVWLLAGFVIGEFAGGVNYAITGAIILGGLGVLAALYAYYLGSAAVLSAGGRPVGGSHPCPTPHHHLPAPPPHRRAPTPKGRLTATPTPTAVRHD